MVKYITYPEIGLGRINGSLDKNRMNKTARDIEIESIVAILKKTAKNDIGIRSALLQIAERIESLKTAFDDDIIFRSVADLRDTCNEINNRFSPRSIIKNRSISFLACEEARQRLTALFHKETGRELEE